MHYKHGHILLSLSVIRYDFFFHFKEIELFYSIISSESNLSDFPIDQLISKVGFRFNLSRIESNVVALLHFFSLLYFAELNFVELIQFVSRWIDSDSIPEQFITE